MKNYLIIVLATLFSALSTSAQDCKVFIPDTEGMKLEYEMKNAKGKLQGSYSQRLVAIEETGDTTVFKVEQTSRDKKGNEIKNDFEFKCTGNKFIFDMDMFTNEQQMEAYKDMEMTMTADEIAFPADLKPGTTLKDGSMTMEVEAGAMTMTFATEITNRKVLAIEEITTEAGTFECFKVSQDIESKVAFAKIFQSSVLWYTENIGLIRSEAYNKKGKLQSVTELLNIVK